MSLQSGWDRDSQAKKDGMAGLTGLKNGRESGSEKPIGDPHFCYVSQQVLSEVAA